MFNNRCLKDLSNLFSAKKCKCNARNISNYLVKWEYKILEKFVKESKHCKTLQFKFDIIKINKIKVYLIK